MNTRITISITLLLLGGILVFLPLTGHRSFAGKPSQVLSQALDPSRLLTPDQVARMIVNEDSSLRIIDVRSPEQYASICLPGAVNIPLERFLGDDLSLILNVGKGRNIVYSNGNLDATYALLSSVALRYENVFMLNGGLNAWIETMNNSSFSGERISARENSLYETRTRAKKMFNEFNSLPDSLKLKYLQERQGEAKKLDGGCE